MNERYPTIHGVAISPLDIWLPESNLNPEKDKNYNNHHTEYYARMYGDFLLSRVFHDLASNQIYMLRDVHEWLHQQYGAPKMPTPIEMLETIEQAWATNQVLQLRKPGGYYQRPIDTLLMQDCIDDYDDNRDKM